MDIKIASVDSIIIYFGNKISKDTAYKVKKAYFFLKEMKLDGIIEIIPSYTTIFISYDIFKYNFESLKQILEDRIVLDEDIEFEDKIHTIDVFYGLEVGLDLANISKKTKLHTEEIIELHSNKIYDVYAIGFLPGFAYLASVDKKIAMPRLKSPRKLIPKGSVSIADTQTAVYPQNSPGGWNVVGRTAFEFFDKNLENLCPINVGDKIKFNPISKNEFLNQGGLI